MIYKITLGGKEFEVLAEAGEYDYSWNESKLFRGPDGQLYYAHASGCSCNSFSDEIQSESDLTPVAFWQSAVVLAKENLSERDAVDFAERCAEVWPSPSPRRDVQV